MGRVGQLSRGYSSHPRNSSSNRQQQGAAQPGCLLVAVGGRAGSSGTHVGLGSCAGGRSVATTSTAAAESQAAERSCGTGICSSRQGWSRATASSCMQIGCMELCNSSTHDSRRWPQQLEQLQRMECSVCVVWAGQQLTRLAIQQQPILRIWHMNGRHSTLDPMHPLSEMHPAVSGCPDPHAHVPTSAHPHHHLPAACLPAPSPLTLPSHSPHLSLHAPTHTVGRRRTCPLRRWRPPALPPTST